LELKPIGGISGARRKRSARRRATYRRFKGTEHSLGFYDGQDDCLSRILRLHKRLPGLFEAFRRLRACYTRRKLLVIMDNLHNIHDHQPAAPRCPTSDGRRAGRRGGGRWMAVAGRPRRTQLAPTVPWNTPSRSGPAVRHQSGALRKRPRPRGARSSRSGRTYRTSHAITQLTPVVPAVGAAQLGMPRSRRARWIVTVVSRTWWTRSSQILILPEQ